MIEILWEKLVINYKIMTKIKAKKFSKKSAALA